MAKKIPGPEKAAILLMSIGEENAANVMANMDEINDEHDAYESIWQLYLYYNLLNKKDEALKYLEMAYEIVGTKNIEKYQVPLT